VHGTTPGATNCVLAGGTGASPADAAATGPGQGGVTDERLVGEVARGRALRRAMPNSKGKVGTIFGYC